MKQLQNVPPEKNQLLGELADQLSRVPGIVAVVLGGSSARDTQMEAISHSSIFAKAGFYSSNPRLTG